METAYEMRISDCSSDVVRFRSVTEVESTAMKVNISLVDLLLLRMTQAVAITLDSSSAAAGVPWRFCRANQAGSNPCSASRAGCSAWINVQPLSAPSALTSEERRVGKEGGRTVRSRRLPD